MSKTKVIAFANNKGGSGKTTTCSNVGCAMATLGKKVLMIDGDMQLNLTISYFDEEQALEYAKSGKNLHSALKEEKDLADYIVGTDIEGLDIIPSSSLMSGIEFDLFSKWQREFVLKKCLERVRAKGYYDYIYAVKERGKTTADVGVVAGDFWETQNEYTIYLYLFDPTQNYDQLIGVKTVLSH